MSSLYPITLQIAVCWLTNSFLAIFADVATIAVAYDRAPYARQPVEWQLPKVWIISTIMGEPMQHS